MDFQLLAIFILMLTRAHTSPTHEATSSEIYWRSVLPQTPIPASILDLLRQEMMMDSFEMKRTPTAFVSYKCAATEEQIHNNTNTPLLFLKARLNQGTQMTLDLTKIASSPPFLSVKKAKATPFSSAKLPEILSLLNIEHGSTEAVAMQRTLAECEELPLDGEIKRCVTSMEAMVEFVQAELGSRDVRVFETVVAGDGDQASLRQNYVVGAKGGRRVEVKALVSCHPEPYPNAVYYCHTTMNVEAYEVHLLGMDGVAVDAVATCHTNTSSWNPNYIGFKMLKVKPGTAPICHFLPQGHLIFASLSKEDAFML